MAKKLFVLLAFSVAFVSVAIAGWDPLTTNTIKNLSAVTFLDENTGYAVGADGTAIKTNSAGTNFSVITVGANGFNDVVFASSQEGYLLGESGALYKTTDEAATFTQMTLPAALAGAAFRKGSANGTKRAFSAYTGADSYLYSSDNSGNSFTAVAVPNFNISGVVLTTGDAWVWGQASNGNYAILRNGAEVWTSASQKVNDIFFVNDETAWAVGDNGLLLSKTSTNGNTWGTVSTGVAANLTGSSFISYGVGWIVGESGTILFTKDGGQNFFNYADAAVGSTSLRDIYIHLTSGFVAHAYIVGDGGQAFKLQSPLITSITPNARMQGWVGTVEVTGTNFMTAASLEFSGDGLTVFSNSTTGGTKLTSLVIIDPAAATSTRDVTVNNPDWTTSTESNAFTVTANPGAVTISHTWFDGNIPQPSCETITETPTISFEVASTLASVTGSTLNGRILFYQGGVCTLSFPVPASTVTVLSPTSVNVCYTIEATLPTGPATVELYAEDSAGNVGRKSVKVYVGSVGGATEPAPGTASIKNTVTGFLKKRYNMKSGAPMYWQFQFAPGEAFPLGVTFMMVQGPYTDILLKKTYPLPPRVMSGLAGKVNFELMPTTTEMHRGIVLLIATNPAQGNKVVGKMLAAIDSQN